MNLTAVISVYCPVGLTWIAMGTRSASMCCIASSTLEGAGSCGARRRHQEQAFSRGKPVCSKQTHSLW